MYIRKTWKSVDVTGRVSSTSEGSLCIRAATNDYFASHDYSHDNLTNPDHMLKEAYHTSRQLLIHNHH